MKPSDKNSIDNLFKQGLEEFELAPSASTWMEIERQLDKKKSSKTTSYFLRMSIAASVLICLFVGYYWVSEPTQKNELATIENQKQDKQEESHVENKIIKNNSSTMQPNKKDNRLADVVELKSRKQKPVLQIKKVNVLNPVKKNKQTEAENDAIELLKKLENDQAESGDVPEEKKVIPQKNNLIPPTNVASNKNDKRELNSAVDVLNFIANKVSGNEDSKLVAINDQKNSDGSKRKAFKIDLGFVKLSRVKNTN